MPLALCMHSYNCRATLLNSAMETLDSAVSTPSRTSDSKPQTSSPLPPSVLRLWRPAAQRNLRNQWSQLVSCKNRWFSASSVGRSHATALVNFHLSQRYMPDMKLGVLSDMPDIKKRACLKLFKRQELQRSKLVLSYKDMTRVILERVERVVEFQYLHFIQSLRMRLLVLEFMSIGYDTSAVKQLHWSTQLYDEEFKDLRDCNLYCEETHGPVPPRLRDGKSDIDALRFDNQPNPEVLQVYLTTWLAEANIDTPKVPRMSPKGPTHADGCFFHPHESAGYAWAESLLE
ncbi:hypothetical protein JHK85_011893 [Glycine max]|nr:hypothetical protein JHK85_011893 [Glycine max]